MSALGRLWHRIWFAEFDPLSVGMFRICLGVLLLVYFCASLPNWERFFAADGLLSLNDLDPRRAHIDWWTVFHWTEGVIPIQMLWWIGLLAAVGFIVGYQTRLCTIVLFVLIASMVHRNRMVVNGEDLVFRMLLLYSCFAPLGAALSLDRWRERRRAERQNRPFAPPRPTIWAVRLMQVSVALIYVISLPNKLVDDIAWLDGTATYWAVHSNMWGRWPTFAPFYNIPLIKCMTYGTILIEGAFPLLVWLKKTKLLVTLGIAGLHIGIAVMLQNVTFFTLSMVCAFWIFVPASTVRRIGRWLWPSIFTSRTSR